MKIAVVGVGGAGGRIVDSLFRDDQRRGTSYLGGACVVDTDTDELQSLRAIPDDNRHAFGHFVSNGTGADGDRTTGIAAIEDERLEVRRAIDPLVTSAIDGIVLVAGLAGGTGGGATAYIADALSDVYDRPLYAVSILPAGRDEQAATNTVQSLRSLGSVVDGQLLFDNEAWLQSGETVDDGADRLNDILATRLGALFSAGEATNSATVGQSVIDASEIINTLSASGFATLGYGSQELEPATDDTEKTLIDRLRSYVSTETDESTEVDTVRAHKAVETTLRRAVRGKLTVECTRESTDRALSVVAGPPEWLNRDAIADGRSWLEDELASPEIRSGDVPTPNQATLSVLVLCSGITEVPRLDELEDLAA
ncbi:tubulin/FtsZ family protein [Haloarcula laminariae]|uniref:tubulin/FtsZ family protein n=1 Tax=Haloarcula laminariae TaxID=2961577 RepID=UPI0024074508|nr:tubulin/FtsZ family protein [Halomicroarcula sp. FL173]